MSTSTSTHIQQVTPELRRWIIAQAEAGCVPEDVVKAMVASGWDEEVALDALEQTLRACASRCRAAPACRSRVCRRVPTSSWSTGTRWRW
jgi:hypothetical protein